MLCIATYMQGVLFYAERLRRAREELRVEKQKLKSMLTSLHELEARLQRYE